MSDEKKTEEVIEETVAAQPEAEEPMKEAPKEEKKEKAKKDKADKKKEEPAEPKEEKKSEPAPAQSDAYLRLLAEYDNYRKRSQREKDALYADIRADTLKSFLPVYDNLMRALNQSTADEAYRKGVEMIMAQFNKTLESLGVEKIDSLGKTFEPERMEAIATLPSEEIDEGCVSNEAKRGWMLKEKLLRAAQVVVSSGKAKENG